MKTGRGDGTLIVTRGSAYADKLRKYVVVLDGDVIGEIGDGEEKSFSIKPGAHTLRLRIDWARSNEMSFQVKAGKSVRFRCFSSLAGVMLAMAIVYALFLPHKYITLERAD